TSRPFSQCICKIFYNKIRPASIHKTQEELYRLLSVSLEAIQQHCMDGLMSLLLGGGGAGANSSGDAASGSGSGGAATGEASPIEQLCQLKAWSIPGLIENATAMDQYVKDCVRQNDRVEFNSSTNYTGTDFAYNYDSAKEAAVIAIYCFLCTGCLLGNVTVISVILANKTMRRSITNILIINLAVADFGVGVFSGLQAYLESSLQASSSAYSNAPLMCKFQQVLQVTILAGSVCILLIISIDRYMAILYPLTQRQNRKKRWYIVVSICCWLFALFFALPNLYFFNYSSSSRMCQVTSRLKDFFFIYYCVSVALLYAIPFGIMAFAYGRVSARLLSSINQFGVEFSGGGGGGGGGGGRGRGRGDEPTTTIVTSEATSEAAGGGQSGEEAA
uniref:G_PROTEIN_RECEP_F1_2 domain-containing protein n=1 Tax=Macrostomum lignano TaxID=282301 RepID=A0A1I8JFQ1_9PLAT